MNEIDFNREVDLVCVGSLCNLLLVCNIVKTVFL